MRHAAQILNQTKYASNTCWKNLNATWLLVFQFFCQIRETLTFKLNRIMILLNIMEYEKTGSQITSTRRQDNDIGGLCSCHFFLICWYIVWLWLCTCIEALYFLPSPLGTIINFLQLGSGVLFLLKVLWQGQPKTLSCRVLMALSYVNLD